MGNTKWNIGVCNWSLQAGIDETAAIMKELGINHVHLEVGSAIGEGGKDYLDAVKKQDWVISSTMIGFAQEDYSSLEAIKKTGGIVPDDYWDKNKELFLKAIDITAELKVPYLSSHFGFLDMTEPQYAEKIMKRVRLLADAAAAKDVVLLL